MRLLVLVLCLIASSVAVELTFELPDNAKECFHQEIKVDVQSTLEFQVSFSQFQVFFSKLIYSMSQ